MDAVYRVRPGGQHEELRYSLRSLAAWLPVDRVWIAGWAPEWVRGVSHVPLNPTGSRYLRSLANLLAACHAGVSERFVLIDDDMFLLRPWGDGVVHRGDLEEHARVATHDYRVHMQRAARWLREHGYGALSYELHCPMVLSVSGVLGAVKAAGEEPWVGATIRSLVGNMEHLGGERIDDVKVRTPRSTLDLSALPYVSTSDGTFRASPHGRAIRELFPDLSPYES